MVKEVNGELSKTLALQFINFSKKVSESDDDYFDDVTGVWFRQKSQVVSKLCKLTINKNRQKF